MEKIIENAIEIINQTDCVMEYNFSVNDLIVKLVSRGDYKNLLSFIELVQESNPENLILSYVKALAYFKLNKFDNAKRSIPIEIPETSEVFYKKFRERCDQLRQEISKIEGFANLIDSKWLDNNIDLDKKDEDFVQSDLTSNKDDFLNRFKSIKARVPSILILSMARAGSSSIIRQLSVLAGSVRADVHSDNRPVEHDLNLGYLTDFLRGGLVSYVHSRAIEKNIKALIQSGVTKFVLHVRDPRQSFLSNFYRMHAEKSWKYNRHYMNEIPLNYEKLSSVEQIDWHIDNTYSYYWINWIKEWLEVISGENSRFQVKVLTYENFINDPAEYYKSIGTFYNFNWSALSKINFLKPDVSPPTHVGGRSDLWRSELNSRQINRLQELTPSYLLEEFSWAR